MNVQHERNFSLQSRVKPAQLDVPWHTNSIVGQIGFFILTCIGLGAFRLLISVFDVPKPGLITGVIAIALAEYLISARKWFFSGVEAALWIGGVFLLISELPSSGTPESNLVIAAAAAIAGLRVRNPLFGALAAIFVMIYFERRFDLGVLCALILAFIACIALLREWRRPSTEALWIVLAIVMPVAGRVVADEKWINLTIALYATLGVIALVLAILKRHHALFLSAMIAITIAGFDVAEKIVAPPEVKFAVAGALLLAIAFVITRALRDRTSGFVLTIEQLTPFDDAIESGATISLQPSTSTPTPTPESAPQSGGGSFGGAGASGDY
ncbi:MAG TPA: hypothetical protein VGQ76_17655 [Thermoanaerobaculia bacterium]|jgi:uncharacterized membrane protein YgcG|nr:hypothetical protein [Thermoanaerobaculia bacterium]